MKFAAERPYANPEAAARKLKSRIQSKPFRTFVSTSRRSIGLSPLRAVGWLHDSGNYVKFTQGQRGAVRVKEAAS
jgi:hypothetical protein